MTQPTVNKERSHHKHGMSVLNYLAACSGYESRSGTSEAAEDGDRLHDVMEKVVQRTMAQTGVWPLKSYDVLKSVLQEITVGEDEEVYLEFCCRELDIWLAKMPRQAVALVEQRVYIRNPNGSDLNFGHYDLLIFVNDEVAILFDWKFGWIPVPPANTNWQGKGYAVGVFQEFPKLKRIGVVFVQPKLRRTTNTSYRVEDLQQMYAGVKDVIVAAENPHKTLRMGPYCDYCAVAGTCTALLNNANRAVAIHDDLPIPAGFTGLQINTADDAVRAMFVLDRLKVLLERSEDLKQKAKDFARINNGFLATSTPDGKQLITLELKSRSTPRSIDKPGLVAEALKDFVSADQILGACDLNITTLETIFADALVNQRASEAKVILDEAEKEARGLESRGDQLGAAQAREEAKRSAKTTRLTRKKAKEILTDLLTAHGLLSRPDGKVEFLKVRVEKQAQTSTQLCQ